MMQKLFHLELEAGESKVPPAPQSRSLVIGSRVLFLLLTGLTYLFGNGNAPAATLNLSVKMVHCVTNSLPAWRVGFPNADCDLSYAHNFIDFTLASPTVVYSGDITPMPCHLAVCEWTFDSVNWYPAEPASQGVSAVMIWKIGLYSSSNQVLNSHSYGYNQLNQRTNTVRMDGSYAQYAYDAIGQLTKASGFESNGTARLHEKMGYAFDAGNNLSYRTNNVLVQTFTVNALNGLTNVTRNATNALTVAGTTTIGATNVTVNGSTANLYADNTFAREGFTPLDGNNAFTAIAQDAYGGSDSNSIVVNLPLSTTFQYDLNGNMTNDSVHALDYDDENQLVTNTVAGSWKSEFVYDGKMRRRIRREYSWQGGTWVKTNEVRYVYDGNLVLQDRDSSNNPLITYTRGLDLSGTMQGAGGIGGLLSLSQPSTANSQPAYYHADGSGNVTALVNQRQEIVARYLYDPFGNTLSAAGPMAEVNLYRFSSKELHPNSGLVYYLCRYYDPGLQRWMSRDPLREAGGINLYSYVQNAPVGSIDPLGLAPSWEEINSLDVAAKWALHWLDAAQISLKQAKATLAQMPQAAMRQCPWNSDFWVDLDAGLKRGEQMRLIARLEAEIPLLAEKAFQASADYEKAIAGSAGAAAAYVAALGGTSAGAVLGGGAGAAALAIGWTGVGAAAGVGAGAGLVINRLTNPLTGTSIGQGVQNSFTYLFFRKGW